MKCNKCGGEDFSFMEMVEYTRFHIETDTEGKKKLVCNPAKGQTLFIKLECDTCHTEVIDYEVEWI